LIVGTLIPRTGAPALRRTATARIMADEHIGGAQFCWRLAAGDTRRDTSAPAWCSVERPERANAKSELFVRRPFRHTRGWLESARYRAAH
jgi:hypothetical protein